MSKIVVVGGGAAGLLCAAKSAEKGNDVIIIEKMNRCGRKLMITGKGRCNVTNASFELDDLISNVPTNPRFLYSAFSNFMPYDTMALFEELGVPLKIERGNRVFPQSDKAVDIVDALVNYAKQSGVKIIQGKVKAFELDGNAIKTLILDDKTKIECDKVCLCTGGKSYPLTGSTGDGYTLAKQAGHTIVPLKPSLVPFTSGDKQCKDMQGLALKNVALRIVDKNSKKTVYSDFGEMLFTHFGMSGPMILSASSHIRDIQPDRYIAEIDLKPALNFEHLDRRIQNDFKENSNRDVSNAFSKLLPRKIIVPVLKRWGVPFDKKCNSITKEERHALCEILKCFTVEISGFRPIEEAIITSGGVKTSEINPKTMESKLVSGLYFAGEVIDCDAYTGGFNLQIAWSTGRLAGENSAYI